MVAGFLGGRPDAYLTTIKAWPGFTGSAFRPPWVAALSDAGAAAWLLALVLLGLLAGLLVSRPARRWGPELWAWTASSIGFIVATTSASTSLPRYLLLAFPLGLVLMPSAVVLGSRATRVCRPRGRTRLPVTTPFRCADCSWVTSAVVSESSLLFSARRRAGRCPRPPVATCCPPGSGPGACLWSRPAPARRLLS